MKKFFRQHSEKITAFFLAVVFTFGFSVSVWSHLAFAADLGSYSDYNASNWEDVGEDARELAQSYLDVLKSTSLGNYFDEVTDIPMSWLKLASDGAWALSPISGIYYLLNSDGEIEVEHNKQGSTGTRHHLGEEPDDVVVDSDTFKKVIDETDLIYYPLGSTSKVSLKTDRYFSGSTYDNVRNWSYLTFLARGNFFGVSGLKEVYCVPFFQDSEGEVYFGNYCGYFSLETQIEDSSGTVEIYDMIFKYVDVINNFDLNNSNKYLSLFENNSYSFSDFEDLSDDVKAKFFEESYCCCFCDHNSFLVYPSFSAFLDRGDISSFSYPDYLGFLNDFYNSKNISLKVSDVFNRTNFPSGSISNTPCDWGFYISDTPILMDCFGADIDTSKIPDNYYITISGDTIYDYSITNPETGQSSTVNEYMTNNYTYITNNPSGDGSGSSGTTDGNVTVGGNVGVDGNVNVGGVVNFGGEVNVGVEVSPIDINVNVSGNAGSSGAGESASDPELPDTSIFNGYLNDALDESTGIRRFISDFFGGLPGEITTLVCIGLVLAILCRLFGR